MNAPMQHRTLLGVVFALSVACSGPTVNEVQAQETTDLLQRASRLRVSGRYADAALLYQRALEQIETEAGPRSQSGALVATDRAQAIIVLGHDDDA
jgi:hypothetical protein